MAGVSRGPGGSRRVQFVDHRGIRRAIQLGGRQARTSQQLARFVGNLVAARTAGTAVDRETAAWLADVPARLHSKLVRFGLASHRGGAAAAEIPETLQRFLDHYRESRPALKPNTTRNLKQTANRLVATFGATKRLDAITEGDADRFRNRMDADGLSAATISREIKRAKQFFRSAVRNRLLAGNPFDGQKAGPQTNRERMHFVDRETTAKVLDACPDSEWRLIFALCRFGGLRCPSELLTLKWSAVDWAGGRFTVSSPKTEHHAGGGKRVVPIFPELLPYLRAAFEEASPGAANVVARYREANSNLRTQLGRILERASVAPWPKLFVNLRSSRETELAAEHPIHVVCAWLGNSPAVADKHYLQVTEDHFRAATGATQTGSPAAPETAPKKVTQKVTQHGTATARSEQHETRQPRGKRVSLGAGEPFDTPTGSRTIAVSSERHASGEKSHSFCHSFSGANVQQLAAALVALAAVPMDDATRSTVAREIAERLADEGCR